MPDTTAQLQESDASQAQASMALCCVATKRKTGTTLEGQKLHASSVCRYIDGTLKTAGE